MGIPIQGGPWHGSLYFGGSPHERRRPLHTLPGGCYFVSPDGLKLWWCPERRAA
jgi:hypothetical protein